MAMPYTGAMPSNPFGQPQLPDWLTQSQPLNTMSPAPLDLQLPQIKKGGMFGGKDIGTAISAALNGYLAGSGNPAGVQGLSQLHQQRMLQQQQAMQEQEYQRHRQDGLTDYSTKLELASKFKQPDQLTQYMINAGIDPHSEQGKQLYLQAATNRVNPFQAVDVTGADGSVTRQYVRPPMSGAPSEDDEWDYGDGGTGSNAGGGFPG